MGVDHDFIFAYGFLLKPFSGDFNREMMEKILDDDQFNNITFVTDAYCPSEIFVYNTKSGFKAHYRGSYSTFGIDPSLKTSFEITEEEVEALNKVREHFKDYLIDDQIGWTAFPYAH
jgi:hypothetical protein